MALTSSKASELGSAAPDFSLPGVDGKFYRLSDFKDKQALVVIFMCNHCPYVIAVQDRINRLAKEYQSKNVALIGINSNNTVKYPEDSFDAMKVRAKEHAYVFPYLFDESQDVAKAYDAACTPDPYVFENVNGKFLLRYRGRIDDSWKDEFQVKTRDLAAALDSILMKKPVNSEQIPSMGCNIKWK